MATKQDELLTPEGFAQEMVVPLSTIYQWVHKGTGPRSLKVGRHLRFRREDVEEWLKRQEQVR